MPTQVIIDNLIYFLIERCKRYQASHYKFSRGYYCSRGYSNIGQAALLSDFPSNDLEMDHFMP